MAMPALEFSDFIIALAQFALGLLEALFDRPAQAAESQRGIEPYQRGVIDY